MSDTEASSQPHPAFGGKSIESVQAQQAQQDALKPNERPPYKSWRKKYRKMRTRFDNTLEENKRLYREEQKLEGLAKRLREELDATLEILLDVNQNSAISPELRYEIRLPHQKDMNQKVASHFLHDTVFPPDADPETAKWVMYENTEYVQKGHMRPHELQMIREYIQERLAAQEVRPLSALEQDIPHPISSGSVNQLPSETQAQQNPGYWTGEQEDAYLARLDAELPGADNLRVKPSDPQSASPHHADLTPRELERQMELMNPQSQHNWIKIHIKPNALVDGEEAETPTAQDVPTAATPKAASKKRASGKNLAKHVGDKVMERMMREGLSPSAGSGMGDEDELAQEEGAAAGPRKKGGDKDPTFRAKGGKTGSTKTKRKRTTDEGGSGGGKRMRAAEIFD